MFTLKEYSSGDDRKYFIEGRGLSETQVSVIKATISRQMMCAPVYPNMFKPNPQKEGHIVIEFWTKNKIAIDKFVEGLNRLVYG